jgi:5-formyltetrahydrofolate cyclo-ligase
MTKKELRQKYKSKRQELQDTEIDDLSLAITNKVLTLPVWDKTYFHVFLPIIEQKEVNTEFILHLLSGKDKEIIISKSDFETREMTHFLLTDNTKIKKNEYNIPEPVDGLEVPANKIEVIFVPLLAFDKIGNRVGYGKGFYDKFLAKCNPDTSPDNYRDELAKQTIKIGLSFFEADEVIEDVLESDVKLNYCVTPNRVYQY